MFRITNPQSKAIEPGGNTDGLAKYVERACSTSSRRLIVPCTLGSRIACSPGSGRRSGNSLVFLIVHRVRMRGPSAPIGAAAIVAGLLVLGAVDPHASQDQSPSSPAGRAAHRDFVFSAGGCELGPEFCAASGPRGWAAGEVELVSAALDEIAATDLGRRIIERSLANGFNTIRRFTRAARPDPAGGYQVDAATVATAHHDDRTSVKTIDLTDRFFERRSLRDQFSGPPGYLLTTEILAHELVHGVDADQRYSGTVTFRQSVRLGMPAALQADVDAANAERSRLVEQGRHADDWYASRLFAIVRLRGRLPSLHALEGYREAFAEIGAHLVLDRNTRSQFEPRVIQYVERSVAEPPAQGRER
jgi:hypothetical protein